MAQSPNTVTVSILGKDYQINCPPDQEISLRQSAGFLDRKMKEIKANSNIIGLDRLAVMAALNISHEFLTQGEEANQSAASTSSELLALSEKMDKALIKLKGSS